MPDLVQPGPSGCQGSLVRPPGQAALFYAGPASTVERHNMSVKRSVDGGASFPDAVVVYPGPSSYSSLAALRDGTEELGLLFEHSTAASGGTSARPSVGALSFVRVPMSLRNRRIFVFGNVQILCKTHICVWQCSNCLPNLISRKLS
eukprot:SAG11_NODE_1803_length_4235_cov_6.769342_3_plen_147_part_00